MAAEIQTLILVVDGDGLCSVHTAQVCSQPSSRPQSRLWLMAIPTGPPPKTANMDPMRGVSAQRRGNSPSKLGHQPPQDPSEQLLDAFKAAALSVTKLYKSSAAAESKARQLGYQDCLDDLLSFLDRRKIGLDDGEGWEIRRWATERLDGRDSTSATAESDDEGERVETLSSPDLGRSGVPPPVAVIHPEESVRMGSAPPTVLPVVEDSQVVVPTQDEFTFQSTHPYPQDTTSLNIGSLALSDSRSADSLPPHSTNTTPITRRTRYTGNARSGARSSHLGRGGGQKRKLNFAEIFDLGSLGYGKDVFGNGSKRSRHI